MNPSHKIVIIGGTGRAGRHIAAEALDKGYQVRMLIRNPDKLSNKDPRIEIIRGTIEDTDIKQLLKGCETVINTFGQPAKSKPIYSRLTQSILQTMQELHIKRYIGVTGGSLTLEGDQKGFINKIGAKIFQLLYGELLKDRLQEWRILNEYKQIEWSMVRLPFIVEGSKGGVIKEHLTDMPGTRITSGDIAEFLVRQIHDKTYVHRSPFIANKRRDKL
ncbi:NAD(P)-dependent oxidoreductase [Marinicrinis lubricantis]|uniref:NAD(P)-dependent oxidoreductase n=1 Tax=Marinicrinis lubricantis TaxID=2086470 RepID=A0ABW1IGT9_9BACL